MAILKDSEVAKATKADALTRIWIMAMDAQAKGDYVNALKAFKFYYREIN